MKVWVVEHDPHDYDQSKYLFGIYETEEKAIQAIKDWAVELGEPMLILEHEYDTWECAECYHYPNYNGSIYYVKAWEVE